MLDVEDGRIRSGQQSVLVGLQHLGKVPDYPGRLLLRLFLCNHIQKTDIVILLDLGSQAGTISTKLVRQLALVHIPRNRRFSPIGLVEIKDLQKVDDNRILGSSLFLGRFYILEQRAGFQGRGRKFQKTQFCHTTPQLAASCPDACNSATRLRTKARTSPSRFS